MQGLDRPYLGPEQALSWGLDGPYVGPIRTLSRPQRIPVRLLHIPPHVFSRPPSSPRLASPRLASWRQEYIAFEKRHGERRGIEEAIVNRRREEYEAKLQVAPPPPHAMPQQPRASLPRCLYPP